MLRAATPEDVERVLAFWNLAGEDVERTKDTAAGLLTLIERDPGAVILALDEDSIVGSVVVGWDGWRGHIYRLAVESAYRGGGLGARLLAAAEQRARDQGCARIDAIVLDENEPARRLWRRAGYERQARWSRWVKTLA